MRDRCFKAFKTYIEACCEWHNAAELLWRIISNHGLYMHSLSYSKESVLLDKLILEITDNSEAQTAIGANLIKTNDIDWNVTLVGSRNKN